MPEKVKLYVAENTPALGTCIKHNAANLSGLALGDIFKRHDDELGDY